MSRPSEFVREPAITMGLTVQPDVLADIRGRPGFRGRGLLARFWYAYPRSPLGHRSGDPPPVPDDVRAAYDTLITGLLRRPVPTAPHPLRLAPEARERYLAFFTGVEAELAPHGTLGWMTDWGGKIVGGAVRLAGLLHMAAHASEPEPWATPISGETFAWAVQIARYLIAHAQGAYAAMHADPAVEGAKRILNWIHKTSRSTFSKRDLFEGTRGYFQKADALDRPLDVLVEHRFLRPCEEPERPGPGRKPSTMYDVNPLWERSPGGHSANSANCASEGSSEEPEPDAPGVRDPHSANPATAAGFERADPKDPDDAVEEFDL